MQQRSANWMRLAAILALTGGYAVVASAEDAPATAPEAAPVAAPAAEAVMAAEVPGDSKPRDEHHPMPEAPAGPKISGYIQSSYTYNLNDPASGATFMRIYDSQHNTFIFNNAHVAITGTLGKVGYVIESDIGYDASVHKSWGFGGGTVPTLEFDGMDPVSATSFKTGTASAPDPDADIFDLQEAYATFPDPLLGMLGIEATVKVGKFVTYEGIEVIESGANPTISRGYLFGFAEPYTHVGGVVAVPVGPATVSAGLLNGWDRLRDDNKAKMGVVNVNVGLGEKVGMVNLTGYSGSEVANAGLKKNSVDLTGVLKLIPMTDLWYQVNYGDEQQAYDSATGMGGGVNKWGGAGISPLIKLTDSFLLGLRGEYFESKVVGAAYGAGSLAIASGTATLCWNHIGGVMTRLEFRHDESASSLPFDDFNGNPKHAANTVSLETIVSF